MVHALLVITRFTLFVLCLLGQRAARCETPQIQNVVNSKGTSLLGSGATLMPERSSFKSVYATVCANARAAVVEKQTGADPTLPGPGQYLNPITLGRNSNGEVKAILSTEKSQPSAKFCGPTPPTNNSRSMAKPGSDKEPGPGQYINPTTFGRGPDGEYRAVTSNEAGSRHTVWCRQGAPRGGFTGEGQFGTPGPGAYINPLTLDRGANGEVKPVLSSQRGTPSTVMGRPRSETDKTRKPASLAVSRRADVTPGPGHYIDPLKEGRNADGEIKALLSNQHSVRTVKFGGRPSSATNARSMAKPNSENEPGPGQYIDPMTEGRTAEGGVRAVLSTQKGTPGVVFSRTPYEGSAGGKAARPKSAPLARPKAGSGGGLVNLEGDHRFHSKYTNHGGAKWGPPGR